MSCEITNLVTRADHVHFVAVRCTKWVWSVFNAQKFWGHVTLATPPFRKLLRDHDRTVPGNMPVKSVALTALEVLEKILWDHVRTVNGNIRVKFEVRCFHRFGAISI